MMDDDKRKDMVNLVIAAVDEILVEEDMGTDEFMEVLTDYYSLMVRNYETAFVPDYAVGEFRGDVAIKVMRAIGCEVEICDMPTASEDDTVH